MHRLGHTGIALLVLAPLAYILVEAHKPLLALVVGLGVVGIEPLPDLDFRLPFLTHRGVSHSLLAAVVVGGILALCGWVGTGEIAPILATGFTAVSEAVKAAATALQSLTPSGATRRIAGLFRVLADSLGGIASQFESLDRLMVAGYGFGIGAGGIVVHLLGDVITVSGIRPLLPISSRRVSLSSLRAKNPLANTGLFAGGVIAIAVVLSVTVGGATVAGMPADLSPIGTAHAQDAARSSHNDSMQINATPSNRTDTQTASQNQTQNASTNATVEFANQTANGSTVTVKRATLPDGGFIVLSSDPYEEIGLLEESMIAVSESLSPGTHRNLTLNVSHSPPGGVQNQTTLNTTSDYSVGLYRDTNNNSRFEYVSSAGTTDTAYLTGTGTEKRFVSDAASITIPGSNTPTPTASIRFTDQSTAGASVTVDSVTLPRGGFVVVHNESYLRGGDPTQTAIGLSGYLSAGTHQNVSVTLTNGSLQQDQTLIAVPSQDTNNNETYDYVRSDGFQDVPYTDDNGVITARASVSISGESSPSAVTSTAASTDSSQPPTAEAASSENDTGGWFPVNLLIIGAGIVVALVIIGVVAFSRRS